MLRLDLRGQICPSTLLVTLKAINANQAALRSGATVLSLLVDHRDATVTIPEAAENMGYRCTVSRSGTHYELTVGAPGGRP